MDVCAKHPRVACAGVVSAWGTGVRRCQRCIKRDKYGRTGTGTCRFVPSFHEMNCRAGPLAFALLHELAEIATLTRVYKKIFVEKAMRDLSPTVCLGLA